MFELNKNFELYASELRASQSMDERTVQELLSHIRDEMDDLVKKGLSEGEAFWIARSRLGDTGAIHAEFSKVNRALLWCKRLFWLLLGYFIFSMIPSIVSLLSIPIYLLNIEWLSFTTPLFGSAYPIPLPLFIFVIAFIGGLWYLISSNTYDNVKNKLTHIPIVRRLKIGRNAIFVILCGYLTVKVGELLTNSLIARHYSVVTVGQMGAADALFTLLWNMFLFLSLATAFVFSLKRKKSEITT